MEGDLRINIAGRLYRFDKERANLAMISPATMSSVELLQQRPGLLQNRRVETFSEPAVDRSWSSWASARLL